MAINLHIYKSDIKHESRIFKMTRTLAENGIENDIHIVGIGNGESPEYERIDEHRIIWRVNVKKPLPIPKAKSYLYFKDWKTKIERKYKNEDISVIQSNSIEDLPIGVSLKRTHLGAKLVYDCHELETEKNGLHGFQKILSKYRERKLISKADYVTVVGPSIANWYKQHYNPKNIDVIMNVPYRKDFENINGKPNRIFRDKFNIPGSSIIFLYQGILTAHRNVELLLEIFSNLTDRHHLVIMGYGNLEGKVLDYTQRYKNIHFNSAVPSSEIKTYTSGADVGVMVINDTYLSYYYMLPNKFFEYIFSGLPVLVSDYPDVGAIVDKYDNGWKTNNSANSIKNLVTMISSDDILKKKQGSFKAREDFGWEIEEKKLIHIYNKIKGVEQ
jgi:glycosyltransferase involved in cell wall biosynthesis